MPIMSTLKPGDQVMLRFYTWGGESYLEPATFVGDVTIEAGRVDKRFESFKNYDPDTGEYSGGTYQWEAYRFKGYWAYGTSAQRVSVARGEN